MINNKGFTLIELMIAISILVLLTTIVYDTVSPGLRTFSKIEEATELEQQAQFIMNFMEEKIKYSKGLYQVIDKNMVMWQLKKDKVLINKILFKDNVGSFYVFQIGKDGVHDYYNLRYGNNKSSEATIEVGNYIEEIEVAPLPSDKIYTEANGIRIRIKFRYNDTTLECQCSYYYRNK